MAGWKEIVRKIAPTIGTALGGPMAGTATKFIADKLLGNPNANDSEIEEAILTASPDQLAKLKELDHQFKLDMKKLDIDLYELEYKDRDSARKLFEVNIWPQIVLSSIFVLGYFSVLFFLIKHPDSLSNSNPNLMGVFSTILGVLTAAIPQILNFWFGSSLGSKEKTKGLNVVAGNNKK
ncbi:hypothetical protein [Marinibactrum halimedae]|uniref:TMhelix containing protein n=1 Tax=Marinibactrum halimedae TaxID=1444977 RepID=A0AA37WNI4_9GAMM|nr:hypothetical protein [Marinibactrum halimedae]MCD9461258.1 hypothetical protein [Marinibactrum halimedae]GLS27588.1 hypothetical protein GCM10007877_33070 [Marinibactrum halimedae]